jgi:hypothetical protein
VVAQEGPGHRWCAAETARGEGVARSRGLAAAALLVCCCLVRGFDRSGLFVDFEQELVSNLGQMASENVTKKCSVCSLHLFREGYNSGWKWRQNSKKRKCQQCLLAPTAQPVAAATGTHAPTPVEQHGVLGGQSAAATGDAASAGAGGDFVAASPPSPVLGAFVFRNLARPVALSNTSLALGGGRAPPQDTLRAVAAGRLPTAAGQPTPGGGGAKSTGKASVPSSMVSTFSRSVCAMQRCAPCSVVGDGMLVDSATAHAPAAAAAIAPGAKPSAVSEGLLARLAASGGAFKADDITFSVRTMLDESAHSLPGSLAVLKPIQKEIDVVRQRLAKGECMPDKLHRTIRSRLSARGDGLRDAMLAALELDLGVRITALADKKAATKCNTDSSAAGARRPDPVLKAMGVDGRDRALWEYYKACAAKKPVYGTRASMSHGPGSYIGQLHASLAALLDPRVV